MSTYPICYVLYLNFRVTDLLVEPSTGNYYPTIYFNEFWLLRDKMIPMNETVSEVQLDLEISPISMMKWQLFQQVDQSFQMQRSYGSMLDGESDELKVILVPFMFHMNLRCGVIFLIDAVFLLGDDCKHVYIALQRVFLEGNPYLLGITMFVSMLHSVFDFLAFKNGNLRPKNITASFLTFVDIDLSCCLPCRYPILEQKQIYGRTVCKVCCTELYLSVCHLPLLA